LYEQQAQAGEPQPRGAWRISAAEATVGHVD
jgi:hypothetical protein